VYDIITIGSATVDVFLKTASAGTELITHLKHPDVCFPLGAKVLVENLVMDTGGGGTNTAVSFARLGFKTGYVGAVADDANGHTILAALRKEHIDFLGKAKKGNSGYSVIIVDLKQDRTILAYKGVNDNLLPKDVPELDTKWVYCSAMLGESWKTLVSAVSKARKRGVRVAFNPSLYLARQGIRKLLPLVDGLDVLVLNKEEAQALLGSVREVPAMLKELRKHVETPVITDGPRGAFTTDGERVFAIHPKKIPVVDTTGAGDAFASAFVAGRMLGKDLKECLKMGQAQAEGVLSAIGAKSKLLTRTELHKQMKKSAHKVMAA